MAFSNNSPSRELLPGNKRQWMHTIPRKPIAHTRVIYSPVKSPQQEIYSQSGEAQGWQEPRQYGLEFDNDLNDINAFTSTRAETHKTNDTGSDGLLKSAVTVSVESESGDKSLGDRIASWRPEWLRPAVLGLFAFFFLFFTAALAVMLYRSWKDGGLFQTDQSLVQVYLWRFGPTAIITMLSILWTRVELQAMMYMPWFALRRRQLDSKSGLSLDYLSMITPVVLVRSIRERHYMVSLVAVVSILLKVQIVLAPGLFSFGTINIPADVNVRLHDSFALAIDNEVEVQQETSAYYMSRALRDFDMLYPFGVTEDVAYQTFGAMDDNPRGTILEPVTAVVDGFFSDLRCLQLAGYSIADQRRGTGQTEPGLDITVDLHFQGCEEPIRILNHGVDWPTSRRGNATYWLLEANQTRPCPGLAQDVPPFLYYSGLFLPTMSNSSVLRFESAGAVLCEPLTWVSKVQVTDDGVAPKITLLPNQTKQLVTTNMWTLIDRSIPIQHGRWVVRGSSFASGPVQAASLFRGEHFNREDPGLYSNEPLYYSVMNLTRFLGPFLGHYRLRTADDASVTGSRLRNIGRLMVNQWTCLSMIAMFFLAACITSITLFRYKRHTSVWYRNPATPLGNLIFLRDHSDFTNGISHSTADKGSWERCSFTPLVLRTWARMSFGLYALLLMTGLILTLRLSNSSDGLATIDNEGYLHLVWTSFPALVALGVSLYISSCDWAYRDLGNLYFLSRKSCSTWDLDSSLLDMMGVRALYYSIRQWLWSVTCSQTLALICGVLTSLVSVLFTVEVIPEYTRVQFQQQTTFNIRENILYETEYGVKQAKIAGLLLRRGEANLTYPKNTFDDLVFPSFHSTQSLDTSRNISVTINTPALRVEPSCFEVPGDAYRLTFRNYTESGKSWFYSSFHETAPCPSGPNVMNYTREIPLGQANLFGRSYAADTVNSIIDPENVSRDCKLNDTNIKNYTTTRYETYVWGEFSVQRNDFDWLSVWRCNYTWAELDTEVDMIASDDGLIIDPENPPRPDLSSTRPLNRPLDVPPPKASFGNKNVADLFPEITSDNLQAVGVTSYFKPLIEPYGPLPLEVFGDPNRVGEILQHLHHNYAFTAAQLANTENRKAVGDVLGTTSGALLLNATLVDKGRRRLVQDPNVTYILVGVLSAVIAVNIWALVSAVLRRRGSESWLLDMDVRGLAPDGWRSIASMAGLLRESNASDHLPPNTELLSREELHGQMSDVSFRLGWFRREWDQTRHFTIGVMEDGGLNYMGVRRIVKRGKPDLLSQERESEWD